MKKDYAHVSIVLDRSGSMQIIKKDIIGGFNTFIEDQKKVEGKMSVSLLTFDVQPFDYVYELIDLSQVKPLDDRTYQPRGGTALNDAFAQLINQTGAKLAEMPDAERPERVLFVCISDGEENSSREYDSAKLKSLIEHQKEKYNWEFLYIGANQDSQEEGKTRGIKHAFNFAADKEGTEAMYSTLSASTVKYRRGGNL